jgi:hypothetical protein
MHGSLRPEVFLYPAAALLATVGLAALVCRYGLARGNRISYGALTLSPLIANAVVFLSFAIFWMGARAFSLEAWEDVKDARSLWLVAGVIVALCLLPALGVAVYYEERHHA